jgi:hypothetical protein
LAQPGVRGTFSQPGPSRPAAAVRLARTLGLAFNILALRAHKEYTVADLDTVFLELRTIMAPYAEKLDAKKDDETELYVDTKHLQKNKKPLFFGAVQVKKAYVSYHLMPVYVKPELLDRVSPELKARMQGKSCFNFASSDQLLFKELAALTKAAYASYKEQGFV